MQGHAIELDLAIFTAAVVTVAADSSPEHYLRFYQVETSTHHLCFNSFCLPILFMLFLVVYLWHLSSFGCLSYLSTIKYFPSSMGHCFVILSYTPLSSIFSVAYPFSSDLTTPQLISDTSDVRSNSHSSKFEIMRIDMVGGWK